MAHALSFIEAQSLLSQMLDGSLSDIRIAGLLGARADRIPSPDELCGFREALMAHASLIDLDCPEAVDICGTGGDGKNTFNISTLAALTAAACGAKVAKHGNVGATSVSGSSDVLREAGIPMPETVEGVRRQFDACGITFMHAPFFHPVMKRLAPIRKSLGFRTFLNYLGPLCNPARPSRCVLGTATPAVVRTFAAVLDTTCGHYSVVSSEDGYDELSLTSTALCATERGVTIITPDNFGVTTLSPSSLSGGASRQDALGIFLEVAHGRGTAAQTAAVVANAALVLQTCDRQKRLRDCAAQAQDALTGGAVAELIATLKEQQ